jgi:hypothetical protein
MQNFKRMNTTIETAHYDHDLNNNRSSMMQARIELNYVVYVCMYICCICMYVVLEGIYQKGAGYARPALEKWAIFQEPA